LATAGGTLVLAVATFAATRSANRSATIAEQGARFARRPVLFNARPQDPPQKVGFFDEHWVTVRDGLAAVELVDGGIYLTIPLRNVGNGLGVIHGWDLWTERSAERPRDPDHFRMQTRDLYVPAGDIGFWQASARDAEDPLHGTLEQLVSSQTAFSIDLLYGDHEGDQRTITRLLLIPRPHVDRDPWLWMCTTVRHWNLDRSDPR
jgi:hypothetical protein